MRTKLDQGTLPRLMNRRSLNCQNPKTRPCCCHFFLRNGYPPEPFWSGGERRPGSLAPLQVLPGSGRKVSPSSSTYTSSQIVLQAGKDGRLHRNVHAGGSVSFHIKMCISAHCRRLQQLQARM